MTELTESERRFLIQSNLIEGEDDNIEQSAAAWAFIKTLDELSNSAIRKAHKILMLDKPYPPGRGWYRDKQGINVKVGGRMGVDYSRVELAMDHWLKNYEAWGWKLAHINFEKIHPFVDGNGRIGRIIMNWQRLQVGLPILVLTLEGREDYYDWFRTSPKNDLPI